MNAARALVAGCLIAAGGVLLWPPVVARASRRRARLVSAVRRGALPAAIRPGVGIPGVAAGRRWLATPTGVRATAVVACLVAGVCAAVLAGPVAGAAGAAHAALGVRGVVRRRRRRADAAHRVATLDALCGLAADLRAGLPAGALEPTVAGLAGQGRAGRLTAAAWRLAERTGAPVADLVERIEADLRALDRASAAAAAQAAGARATAWLLAALPLGGVGLGYVLGTDPLRVLRTPLGGACLALAVLLQFAGLAWTNRLARIGSEATG